MDLIFKIAWRNIMRHRGKSLVIGIILFIGALLMTVGNGVISGMDRGLQKNIINGFTGDIVLVSDEQESDAVFLDMMGKSIEPIYNYKKIDSVLATISGLKGYVPAGKNPAMVINEEGGSPGFTYIIGVDLQRYQSLFPNTMNTVEGRLLKPGEKGILVPTGARKEMFEATNIWFVPRGCSIDTSTMHVEAKEVLSSLVSKDQVVLMGMSTDNTSTDVRLDITGIIKYNALNTIWGHFALSDIESYRTCLGYFTAGDKSDIALSEEQQQLLGDNDENLDDLFSGNNLFTDNSASSQPQTTMLAPGSLASDALAVSTVTSDLDEGIYNLVFILLDDHATLDASLAAINAALTDAGAGARAISWKKAIGTIGSMATLIKGALFVFVMFLFFVAIIIIVNTLSMAALERVTEIGMMRAVGARKGFISSMFLGETALLSFFFGGIGIVTGYLVVTVLSMMNFSTDNDMMQLLYGGETFSPFLSSGDIILAVVQLAIVTGIAVVYPMLIARSITPLDAIARD